MAKKIVKSNKNGLTITSIVAAIAVVIVLIVGFVMMRDEEPSNGTLEKVEVNVLNQLVLEMSDGKMIIAGALPENRENIKMISAQIMTGVEGLDEEGYRTVRIICTDDNNVDYEKILKFPIFGEENQLKSARMDRDGSIIFNTVNGDINGGKILYPSIPNSTMTPGGTSELRPEGGASTETTAQLKITIKGYGYITVAVDYAAAPKTAAAFVSLVEKGYYDGLTFNEVVRSENMSYILTGIAGGPADTVEGEFSSNGYDNPLEPKAGALVLYHPDGNNDGGSSKFLICTEDSPALEGNYTVFGYVLNGMNIIREISNLTITFSEDGLADDREIDKYRNKQAMIESITVTRHAGE